MTIQVLVSTMQQTDYSLLEKMGLASDAVVVNQCEEDSMRTIRYKGHTVVWIDSTERGVSRSRNLAIRHATADICLLCDDDEVLLPGYAALLERAYAEVPEADLMVFNVNRIGMEWTESVIRQIKKVPKHKTYSSVHLSFRRERILDRNIEFNVKFGAGSGLYAHAEDALFCLQCQRRGLKMFLFPGVIADVYYESSSWFSGFDGKYFFDTGAFLAEAYPMRKHLYKWYYVYRFRKLDAIPARERIRNLDAGIRGYKRDLSYAEYMGKR